MGANAIFRGARAAQLMRDKEVRALFEAIEFLRGESDAIAPKDEGTLIFSSVSSVEPRGPDGPIAAYSYDTPYAVPMHEGVEFNFQNNRQPKFMERTNLTHRDRVNEFLAGRMAI